MSVPQGTALGRTQHIVESEDTKRIGSVAGEGVQAVARTARESSGSTHAQAGGVDSIVARENQHFGRNHIQANVRNARGPPGNGQELGRVRSSSPPARNAPPTPPSTSQIPQWSPNTSSALSQQNGGYSGIPIGAVSQRGPMSEEGSAHFGSGIASPSTPSPDEALIDTKKPARSRFTSPQTTPRENLGHNQRSSPNRRSMLKDIEITGGELVLLGSPWAKEGILNHRYYKESPEEGTKSEEWVTVFAVVQKGELLMFKFGGHGAGQSDTVNDGNWREKAQPVGRLQLAHSIAQARPPSGYSNQRPNCVALTLADGSVHFFQAGTDELMNEWVSTCNYWAARRSKEPLAGGNSNEEYGWNRVSSSSNKESDGAPVTSGRNIKSLRNWVWPRTVDSVIHDWKPPTSPTVTSTRDEKGQLEAMKNHVSFLETKLGEHFKLQQPMIALHKRHPGDLAKAQDNWHKCANYLQAEVFKYRLYAKSLRTAMDLRLEKQLVFRPAAAVGRPPALTVGTHHSGKPRRSEDSARQVTRSRSDVSQRGPDSQTSAQLQGRQAQVSESPTSTSRPSSVTGRQDDGQARLPIGMVSQQDPITEESSERFAHGRSPARKESADDNGEAKERALQCWNEDPNLLAKDKIAEWLGGQKPINRAALLHYFQYFDFTGLRLDEAFRRLCEKLYLKAETQQIDRILKVFGKRYWECNPDSVFGNASVAHVVSYSLMQLNTDLHVTESTSKMSRSQFIDHTMESIQTHLQSKVSDGDRSSVKDGQGTSHGTSSFPLPLAVEASSQQVEPSSLSSRVDALSRTNASDTPNGQGSTPRIPTSFVLDEEQRHRLKRALKDIYYATKREQIELNSAGIIPSPALSPDEVLLDTKKPVGFASIIAQTTPGENPSDNLSGPMQKATAENIKITDEELALLGPPWAKEGILSHRYYTESPEEGIKSEKWVEVFAVVQKGELLMFKFGGHGAGQSNTMGNGSWWENAQPVGRLRLAHSIAQARPPPGYTNQRQNCMALTLADGSVYFFQAGTGELVKEWVFTCNYWAARRSKEPLAGGNSNEEYGWNRVSSSSDEESDRASVTSGRSIKPPRNGVQSRTVRSAILDWKPPTSPTVTSTRNEKGQLEATKNHVSILEAKLGEHSKLQQPMIALHKHHPGDSGKAQDNWDKRANYLQAEVFKYRLYAESLRTAMTLRSEKQEALRQAAAAGRLSVPTTPSESPEPPYPQPLRPSYPFRISN